MTAKWNVKIIFKNVLKTILIEKNYILIFDRLIFKEISKNNHSFSLFNK